MKGKKPMGRRLIRKRPIKFSLPADVVINYKDIELLKKFLTDRGKILGRRLTGVTARQQRQVSSSIKWARYLGLLTAGNAKRK